MRRRGAVLLLTTMATQFGTFRASIESPAGSKKKALAFGLLVAMVALSLLLAAKPAHAKTFTVNSTQDFSDIDPGDGICDSSSTFLTPCTLRAAIQESNEYSGADIIAFNIPLTGVKTISPSSQLPPIASRVTINGYTQPGSSPNKNPSPLPINATPLIELDGTNAGEFASGLAIVDNASNTVIKGLVINDFDSGGISSCIFGCTTTGSIKIKGNFIGTNTAGTAAKANGGIGVVLHSSHDTIGGTVPEARNLISGNTDDGVSIVGPGSTVVGNLIGTSKSGTGDLGNGRDGVLVQGSNNPIGGAGAAANVIAFNSGDGVSVSKFGTGNRILSNSIHSNDELGIDLVGGTEDPPPVVGITLNDLKDLDTGANNLQNRPELVQAKANLNGTTTITGKLNSRPRRTFIIQFFASAAGDPDGFGEGQIFLGQKKVETNKKGNVSFSITTTLPEYDYRISATATGGEGTSEFAHWIDQE